MKPGPDCILCCSECSGLVSRDTTASGNTFGAKYWTDGRCFAPMLPESCLIMKCPHCVNIVWVDDLKAIGTVDQSCDFNEKFIKQQINSHKKNGGDDALSKVFFWEYISKLNDADNIRHQESEAQFSAARRLIHLNLEDLQHALHDADLSKERELYVRVRLWWGWNDNRRNGKSYKPLDEAERINLINLIALLDDSANDSCIMKAEALRELGNFREAIALLSRPFDKNFDVTARLILQLAASGDCQLAEIKDE